MFGRRSFLTLALILLLPVSSLFAQQDPSWQGPRNPQPVSPDPGLQPSLPPVAQPPSSPASQAAGKSHPQVMEMPAPQSTEPPAKQVTETPAEQSTTSSTPQSLPPPSSENTETATPDSATSPPYLGIVGRTVQACRYPAGVRVTQVIEGSPAHQAGLKGEATLSLAQAMAGLLAMSPLALLIPQSGTGSEHGGSGDLILAVDGKRIHNHEEFQQQTKDLRPGDIVYLSVLRDGQGLRQVPVQLTTHPGTTTAMVR